MSRSHVVSHAGRKVAALVLAVAALSASGLQAQRASAATPGTISGVAFQDLNRDGVRDADEAPYENHRIYLLDGATGAYLANTLTDATGRYAFSGLSGTSYRVEYEGSSWQSIRQDWVPTTTGSIYPRRTVAPGSNVDFGWRPIVRSTTLGSPISTVVGPSGVRVESYDDAVTAQEIHDRLVSGSLVGAEAGSVTIRFDLGPTSATATSVQVVDGRYDRFSAVVTASWDAWLTTYDRTLFHEYGHAWSMYHGYITQQDPSLRGYLTARGLDGDARVGSSYGWDVGEMIAEDYRQLFGTSTAARYAQINSEIPHPSQVPGLRDHLQGAFVQPAASGATPPAPDPGPTPTLTVSGLAMNPTTVSKTGVASFQLSAPATVTVEVRDGAGKLVRTLMASIAEDAGPASVTWDRKDSSGRRAKGGSYTVVVTATDSTTTTTATTGFKVA